MSRRKQLEEDTFVPNEHQVKIFNAIANEDCNIVVNAFAGCGKSRTIIEALKCIPEGKRVLFVAFNRAIVDYLKTKVNLNKDTRITTCHGFGSSLLYKTKGEGRMMALNDYKYTGQIKHSLWRYTSMRESYLGKTDYNEYVSNIEKLVGHARYNLAYTTEEIRRLAEKHNISLIEDEDEVTLRLLEWGRNNLDEIDFTDMVWLPTVLGINPETWNETFDYIFIDEAQDTSIMQQSLIFRSLRKGGRFIAVGDRNQAINGWCGGDTEAFDRLIMKPNTKELYLPLSYRCSKAVTEVARQFVPTMECREDAPEGEVIEDAHLFSPKDGDMVLCRNLSPLTDLYVRYLEQGVKCYIKGNDIGKNMIRLIDNTNQSLLSASMLSDGVIPRLYERLFAKRDNLVNKYNYTDDDALLSDEVTNFYNIIKSVEILSHGLTNAEDLKKRISEIFSDKNMDGICLSTVHKAKGLEADEVYILCRSLMPSKHAVKEWEIKAEECIQYVAVTRAKNRLHYISEKEFPPSEAALSTVTMLVELRNAEKIIDGLYHKSKGLCQRGEDGRPEFLFNDKKRLTLGEKNEQEVKTRRRNGIQRMKKLFNF